MCSKWLFHFLAEKRLWIPNRFSARLFHDFGKRGRGNREPRRPRMERTPPASCTHACQAPSAPASSVAREWNAHCPRPAYATYIHTYIRTYIHTCMHICIHACISRLRTYSHECGNRFLTQGTISQSRKPFRHIGNHMNSSRKSNEKQQLIILK